MKKVSKLLSCVLMGATLMSCGIKEPAKPEVNEENIQFVQNYAMANDLTDEFVIVNVYEFLLKEDTHYKDDNHEGTCDLYRYDVIALHLQGEEYGKLKYYLIDDKLNNYKNIYLDDTNSGEII